MHNLRDRGVLPNISPRLGHLARTNSEAVLAVRTRDKDIAPKNPAVPAGAPAALRLPITPV
ncbi:hypothetical protein [Nocardia sp. NPDC004604]|uniref:hypothetical protein n=1 Tax=Nocardia sp. NPDC004604 TaxID=3157013 RepID=UPI0033AE4F26